MLTVCLPSADALALLGEVSGVRFVVWDGTGEPPPGLERVTMFVARYPAGPPEGVMTHLPGVQVVQLLSAGVEPWLPLVPDGVTLCSGRGIHGASTAELAVAGMLSDLRELPRLREAQAAHRWEGQGPAGLAGKRVLVLGAGDIGQRVAQVVRVLDADATLVARSARDGVRSISELPALLPEHDVVVIALPHTPQTHGLVDAGFLAAMPDGALLVNVARGSIVDTGALSAELQAGRLRAFLDVTDPEPLPSDHPLWDAPGLVLTPHVGGGTAGWAERAHRLVRTQVERLRDGAPLANRVRDGY